MKTRVLMIALLCVVGIMRAEAQTEQGSFVIGGSLNLQHSASMPVLYTGNFTTNSPTISFNVTPTVGIFAVKNLLTGIQLNYNRVKTKDTEVNYNAYGVGPLLRYYFPFGKFAVFPEAAALFSSAHTKETFAGNLPGEAIDNKTMSSVYRGGAGIVWFATPSIGIEGVVAYRKTIFNYDDKSGFPNAKQSDIYLNIGLQFYLSRKAN